MGKMPFLACDQFACTEREFSATADHCMASPVPDRPRKSADAKRRTQRPLLPSRGKSRCREPKLRTADGNTRLHGPKNRIAAARLDLGKAIPRDLEYIPETSLNSHATHCHVKLMLCDL